MKNSPQAELQRTGERRCASDGEAVGRLANAARQVIEPCQVRLVGVVGHAATLTSTLVLRQRCAT